MDELDAVVAKTLAMIRADPLDGHAQEIGRMCVLWGRLEMSVSFLLSDLMAIKEPTTNNVILGALDFRAKVQAVLPLAFTKKPTKMWFEDVQKELNEIDNSLRPERNRTIHDYWMTMLDGGVQRVQMTAKVINDQREKRLILANFKPVSIDDLKTVQIRIATAIGNIDLLREVCRRLTTLPSTPPMLAPLARRAQDQNP